MRLLYVSLGVLGGLACLAVLYVFGLLAMAYNGGRGSMQVIVPYILIVMGAATLLTLAAAFMNPRRVWTPPAHRRRGAVDRRRRADVDRQLRRSGQHYERFWRAAIVRRARRARPSAPRRPRCR